MTLYDQYRELVQSDFTDGPFKPSEVLTAGFAQGIRPANGRPDCVKHLAAMCRAGLLKRLKHAKSKAILKTNSDPVPQARTSEPVYEVVKHD